MCFARSAAGSTAHFGNASFAAATAALTSASPPRATSASTACVAGFTVWKYSFDATAEPPIKCCICMCLVLSPAERRVRDDGILESPEPIDFAYDRIARHHVLHPLRCARQDDVTGTERHEGAEIFDQIGDIENEIARIARLSLLAV